jgi:hypothetical protein
MTKTFTIRGHKIRTASMRRYIVVMVYKTYDGGERAEIYKRSDSVATCRTHINRYGFKAGTTMHVVDTTTGEEI